MYLGVVGKRRRTRTEQGVNISTLVSHVNGSTVMTQAVVDTTSVLEKTLVLDCCSTFRQYSNTLDALIWLKDGTWEVCGKLGVAADRRYKHHAYIAYHAS